MESGDIMTEQEFRKKLAENLVKYRRLNGLTQQELADCISYSDKSVSKWERGEGVPDVYVLKKLTGIFGCSADALLGVEPVENGAEAHAQNRRTKRKMIPVLAVLLVWLTAAVAYFVLGLLPLSIPKTWLAFVYAIPISFIVLTVFFGLWFGRVFQCVAVSGIIWGTAASLRLTFPMENMNTLFLIAAILQVLAVLWFIMRSRLKPREEKKDPPAKPEEEA